MTAQNYYVLPGVDWVNGKPTPADRIVSLTDEEAEFDIEQGRIVLSGTQPPNDEPDPVLLSSDVLSIKRGDRSQTISIADLVAFLGGSAAPSNTLALSTLVFQSGVSAGAILAAITAPSGWTIAAETTFGGRVAVSGTDLVAAQNLIADAAGTLRLKATNQAGTDSVTKTFDVSVAGTVVPPSDTTAPVIATAASFDVAENSPFSVTLAASEAVTWSKVAGDDAALFTLSGAILSLAAKDFEIPTDQGANNSYVVAVRATDAAGNATDKTITVNVTNVAEAVADTAAPTITSAPVASVAENVAFSLALTANEAVTWAKTGGADSTRFTLAGSTLALAAKDFEAPTDANTDNVYTVQVTATDTAGNATVQTINVTVTNVLEGVTPTLAPTTGTADSAATASTVVLDFPALVEGETRAYVATTGPAFVFNASGDLIRGTAPFSAGTATGKIVRTRSGETIADVNVSITLTAPAIAGEPQFLAVNVQGMDSGDRGAVHTNDVAGQQFSIPSLSDLQYAKDRGITRIRQPFMPERMFFTLGGPINEPYAADMQTVLDRAQTVGLKVILDWHGYNEWKGQDVGGNPNPANLGNSDGRYTQTHWADQWTKIANRFKSHPALIGYDANEPQGVQNKTVLLPQIMQTMYDAICAADPDVTHRIYIEGNDFSGAHNWPSVNPGFPINDPTGRASYESHQYGDMENSGNTDEGDPTSSPPRPKKYPTWADCVAGGSTEANWIARIKVFSDWCKLHGVRGMLGEIGLYADGLDVMFNVLKFAKDEGLDIAPWHFAPNFGSDGFALYPYDGTERPQWGVLRELGVPATTFTLSGPDRAVAGAASAPFTVRYTGRFDTAVTITPTPRAGVVFTPASVTLAAGVWNPSATFTATSATEQTVQIGATSSDTGLTLAAGLEFSTDTNIAGGADNLILTQRFTNASWAKNGSITLSDYVDPADSQTYTRVQMTGDYHSSLIYDVADHAAGAMQIEIKTLGSGNQFIGFYGGGDNDLNFDGTKPKNTWTLCSAPSQANSDFMLHNRGGATDFLIRKAKLNAGAMTAYSDTPPAIQRVILFTDPGQDVDDSSALAFLTTMHEQNAIRLAGVVTSTNTNTAAAAVRLQLDHAGLRDVPVASYKGSGLPQTDYYTSGLVSAFGYSGRPRTSFPDPVPTVRQLLHDAPDSATVLCCVGPLLDLATVMQSPADAIDARSGLDLILAKCTRGIVMGGSFNDAQNVSGGGEFNFQGDPTRAAYVMENWPAPLDLWLVDFNLGESVKIGPLDTSAPASNPLKKAYDLFAVSNPSSIVSGGGRLRRSSFDPIAAELAAGASNRYTLSRGTNVVNTANGNNTFTKGAGRHLYAVRAKTVAEIQAGLETYLDASDTGSIVLPAPTITGIAQGQGSSLVVAYTTQGKATGYQYSVDGGAWTALAENGEISGLPGETTVSVRVRGMRYATAGTASAAVAATTGLVVLWTPAALASDLKLWLDAQEASTLSTTTDATGLASWASRVNGITASQATAGNRPTYRAAGRNGKPSVRFDGSDDRMQFDALTGFPLGAVAATLVLVGYSGAASYRTGLSYGNSTQQRILMQHTDAANVAFVSQPGADAGQSASVWQNNDRIAIAWNDAATSASFTVDGGAVTTDAVAAINTAAGTGGIGAAYARSTNDPWLGDMQEVMVIARILTTQERQKLEGYLAHKWGLTAKLPVGHPYKTAAPT